MKKSGKLINLINIGFGNIVSAEITYANTLDRVETIRSDGRIDGADPSIADKDGVTAAQLLAANAHAS